MSEPIAEMFVEIVELAARLGITRINEMPGCWEVELDSRWWFAVNGHREPTKCSRSDEPLEPFTAYVMFNGWPAGVFTPGGGTFAAGEAANEETFIEALRAAGTGQGRDGELYETETEQKSPSESGDLGPGVLGPTPPSTPSPR